MEIDTGASLSVIREKTYNNLVSKNGDPPLEKSGTVLRTYTGEEVKPKGSCTVDVCYKGGKYSLPLLVLKEEGPALLGRNWLEDLPRMTNDLKIFCRNMPLCLVRVYKGKSQNPCRYHSHPHVS